jgi:hypothetical protein
LLRLFTVNVSHGRVEAFLRLLIGLEMVFPGRLSAQRQPEEELIFLEISASRRPLICSAAT